MIEIYGIIVILKSSQVVKICRKLFHYRAVGRYPRVGQNILELSAGPDIPENGRNDLAVKQQREFKSRT